MEAGFIDRISERACKADFKANEILFREGEPANRFFLVRSGKIALESHVPGNGAMRVAQVGEGEVLGWSWLFAPFSWHFQARALEPASVVTLDGGRLLVMTESDPKFGRDLMKRVTQVVIRRLQSTRQELIRQRLQPPL